jgi:hypothetical protein
LEKLPEALGQTSVVVTALLVLANTELTNHCNIPSPRERESRHKRQQAFIIPVSLLTANTPQGRAHMAVETPEATSVIHNACLHGGLAFLAYRARLNLAKVLPRAK